MQESQTSEVKLSDDDPVAVRMMVEYLYLHAYTPPLTSTQDSTIDAKLSPTMNSDKRKSDMETFVGNKRIKTLDSRPSSLDSSPDTPMRTGPSSCRGRESGWGPGRSSSSVSVLALSFDPVPTPNPSSSSPPVPRSNEPPAANLCLHAKVYALGEKYGIGYLKLFALQRFEAEVEYHLRSRDFLLAIEEAYTSTVQEDRRLRDAIVKTIIKNCHILRSPLVQATVKSTELGFDLLMRFASAQWR
ncbi:BTB domain-containing protein [Fusarium acuminatum]|uniref:BTB domain-containing protein n=1 Tax=Fusarium acuminatum TaxID=5515 RepID=A0ABZ2X3F1_9HYPO